MATPNYSVVFSAQLVAASTVAVGKVLIPSEDSPTQYVVATTANRNGRRSEAIALQAYSGSGTGSIQIQQCGTISAAISGLTSGAGASWVRCNSAGYIERCTPSGSDDIIGYAEDDGRVHLAFGMWDADNYDGGTGGGADGNAGEIQTTDGAGTFAAASNVKAGTEYISLGSAPAASGALRMSNNTAVNGITTSGGGSATVNLLGLNNSNYCVIGATSGVSRTQIKSASINEFWSIEHWFYAADGLTQELNITSTTADFYVGARFLGLDGANWLSIIRPTLSVDRNATIPNLAGNDTFVFEAHTQTLTNKTLTSPAISSPTISGSPVITATTVVSNGNSKVTVTDSIANVQTTDATVTSLATGTILASSVTVIDVIVTALRSTLATAATYKRCIAFRIDGGGSANTIASVHDNMTDEDSAAWDCTVDNSGTTWRVRVTGANSETIQWGAAIRVQSTVS